MLHIEESVDIRAPPEAVFDLVADIPRKTRLNPNVHVLGVSRETSGPVDVGTVFRYRVVVEGHIADYRSHCVAFSPGRMIETCTDTSPPFNVRVTVDSIDGGARLTQTEFLKMTPAYLPVPDIGGRLGSWLRQLFGNTKVIVQSEESLIAEERRHAANLRPRLAKWLASIKNHLEQETRSLPA